MPTNSKNIVSRMLAFFFLVFTIPIFIFKPIFVDPIEVKKLNDLLYKLYVFEWDSGVARTIESVTPVDKFDEEKRLELYPQFWSNFLLNPIEYQSFNITPKKKGARSKNFTSDDFINFIKPKLIEIVKYRKLHRISFEEMTEDVKNFKMGTLGYIYQKKISEIANKLSKLRERVEEAHEFQKSIQHQLGSENEMKPIEGLLTSVIELIQTNDSLNFEKSIPLYKPIVYISLDQLSLTLGNEMPREHKEMLLEIIRSENEDFYIKKLSIDQLVLYAKNADKALTNEILELLDKEILKRREYFNQVVSKTKIQPNELSKLNSSETEYIKNLIKLADTYVSAQEKDIKYSTQE